MNYHPNNTASQYTTKPNKVIELDGNWEVGLLEASLPNKADNVLPDECFFTIYIAGGKYHEVKLPAAYDTKSDQIIVATHFAQHRTFRLPHNQPLYGTFRIVQRKTRFTMKITNSIVEKVRFSEDLACLLGYEPHKDYTGRPENMTELPVKTGSQIFYQ